MDTPSPKRPRMGDLLGGLFGWLPFKKATTTSHARAKSKQCVDIVVLFTDPSKSVMMLKTLLGLGLSLGRADLDPASISTCW